VRGKQPPGDARIFRDDQLRIAQRIQRAQRDVAKIAERRCDER
jgi:hypothetical protein